MRVSTGRWAWANASPCTVTTTSTASRPRSSSSRHCALLGGDVVWRLPNRFTDGYGVSADAVETLAAEGASLLVTVDCGVGAREEVDSLNGSVSTSS